MKLVEVKHSLQWNCFAVLTCYLKNFNRCFFNLAQTKTVLRAILNTNEKINITKSLRQTKTQLLAAFQILRSET